jgi:CubicO group peptidase (beta-lactamase class C family)
VRNILLALLAAFTFLTAAPTSAAVIGPDTGSSSGGGPAPLDPAILAGTELEASHDLGDMAPIWMQELGIEAGQVLWLRWRTTGAAVYHGRFEVRDQTDALVMDGYSGGLEGGEGHRQFSLSLDDLSGAPFTVRIRPLTAGDLPAAQWSNFVVLNEAEPGEPTCFTPAGLDEPIHDKLAQIASEHAVPALAGAIVNRSGMSLFDAVGVRSTDSLVPVTKWDKWHLGSITKSMTSTLAAILIQKYPYSVAGGTRIRDVFGDEPWFDALNTQFKELTLGQLLSQHSGLVANPDVAIDQLEDGNLSLIERRRGYTRYVGQEHISLGQAFYYHNGNFVIAAAMLEEIFEQTWEDLIEEHLFGPLGMNDTGFGTGPLDGVSQPAGHFGENDFVVNTGDNPDGLGPAGLVHTTLVDLGKYVRLYLNGSEGEVALTQHTLDGLFSPYPTGERYNWGWVNSLEPAGLQLWHNGSNGLWYAEVSIRPDEGFGLIAATNIAGLVMDPAPGRGLAAVADAMAMLLEHQTGCPSSGPVGGGAFGSLNGSGSGGGVSAGTASIGLRQPVSTSARTLQVDILPRKCSGLELKARGKVKVAILSTESFDATTLVPGSLRIGDARAVRSRRKDVGGAALAEACTAPSLEEARAARRKDGRKDLLVTFRRADLLELLTAPEVNGEVALFVSGTTFDGETMLGGEVVPVGAAR